MDDAHQPNAIIATVVCSYSGNGSDEQIASEQAAVLAKQIVEALCDAGFVITFADQTVIH